MWNSRNLKLLSRNGRENTGNFPSLDFPCDMNNRRATGRQRTTGQWHANGCKKGTEQNSARNKITFNSISFWNKVKKKTCLLLTSCINFETVVRRVWFVIKSTEVICRTCNRYKRVLCFLWSLWALCDRYWKSISHMIHCYFIVVPWSTLNIYVHCLPRENMFFLFPPPPNTIPFKPQHFSLSPTKTNF